MTESLLGSLLNACEQEPLANSGLIQDEGVLLHVDRTSGRLSFVSENAERFLGDRAADLVGTDGRAWIQDFLPDLTDLPSGAGRRLLLRGSLDLGLGELDALVCATATGWLIELEPSHGPVVDPAHAHLEPLPAVVDTRALAAAEQQLVDTIAELTGFARVMLYEFKADWSGEVLAERVTGATGTYLGLRFPASDIPAIARALYAQTPYRHIPDVAREPVAILGASGEADRLDLTWSDLRSVSPVHREYLRNMQVAASFSVSVILDGKLWGLVACHNPEPLRVPAPTRIRCQELVGDFVTLLASYRQQIQSAQVVRLDGIMKAVRHAVDQGDDVWDGIAGRLQDFAGLLGSQAGALVAGEQVRQSRSDDDPTLIRKLHDWCVSSQSESLAAYERLPELQDAAPGICGVLSISVRAKRHGSTLVGLYFFRPEEAVEIAWAGNPEKPVEVTEGSVKLSPRHSFDKWVEVRTGFSRPWSDLTLFTAAQLQRRLEALL